MNDENPWKLVSSKDVYKNNWIMVREDNTITPMGTKGIYGVMVAYDSVVIVVLNDKN